jgi:hypothetical protein
MARQNFGARLVMAIAAAIMAMALTAQTARAAEQKPYCSGEVVNKLDKRGAKALSDWLKDDAGKPAPMSFKVPGLASTRILCKLGPGGLQCFEVLDSMRCPEAVEVQTSSGSTTVPVDCTGPVNGECDFVQG